MKRHFLKTLAAAVVAVLNVLFALSAAVLNLRIALKFFIEISLLCFFGF